MHVEKQLVELFRRLVPDCDRQWIGADPDEIDEYEYYVGQPLPPFYQWYLLTMGRSMGPLTHPRLDTRIETLLAIYRSGYQVRRAPNATMMLVATDLNEVMPAHYHCDLSHPIRNDALLCRSTPRGGHLQDVSDTFREFLARLIFGRHMLNGRKQLCSGDFRHSSRRPLDEVEPVLKDLGFETYHRTGPRCGLYAREDVALQCNIVPTKEPQPYIFFTFGGEELSIRHVLGQIGVKTTVEVNAGRWDPPLSI